MLTAPRKRRSISEGFRPWCRGTLVAGLFLWGMLAVAVIKPALRFLLGRRSSRGWERIRAHWHRSVCRALGLRLEVIGDPDPEALLLVANHISWLDIVALGTCLALDFVAKADVAEWPVIGYLAKGTDTLFLRRGDARQTQLVAERMAWRLRQGRRLLVFPEGTTTTGERVLRFHSKLFQPAQLTAAPVQAIALSYRQRSGAVAPFVGDDAFLPHLWRVLQQEEIELRLEFCPPITPGPSAGELARLTRGQVVAAIRWRDSPSLSGLPRDGRPPRETMRPAAQG